jgi:hypothetical protein
VSNQAILWGILIVPWLTLFFMKGEDIKRYMPTALFATITSVIIVEVGSTLKWWIVSETAFPLQNISYLYGMNPVITMWMLKFLYKKFGLYVVIDAVLNIGFAYFLLNFFLNNRDIYHNVGATPFQVFLILTAHGIMLYGYQMWQEGIFARTNEQTGFSESLQPAAAKPLPKEDDD